MKIENQQPNIVTISVRKWNNTDKYPCPKCGNKVGMPDYTCEPCNIKIKPVMNFWPPFPDR